MARTLEEIMAEEETLDSPVTSASSADEEPASAPVADATDTATSAENFDLAAWVSGIQPTRRATTIYARPDLLAELDLLGERLEIARAAGDEDRAAEIIVQGQAIALQIEQSALDFVFEGWSSHRIEKFKTACEQRGITDNEEYGLELFAAQCVSPEGATAELFKQIGENLPAQSYKLLQALASANNSGVDVDGPFWRRSSTRAGGTA